MDQPETSVLDQRIQALRDRLQGEDDDLQRQEEERRRPRRRAELNPDLIALMREFGSAYARRGSPLPDAER